MAADDYRKTKTELIAELETLRLYVSGPAEEKAVAESDDRYRQLLRNLPDAVRITCGGTIVYANDAAVRLFGAPDSDSLIGRQADDFVVPEDRVKLRARQRMVLATGMAPMEEQRRRRLDGSVVAVEILSIRISWHGRPAALNVIRDITERRQALEALKQAKDAAEFADRAKSAFLANLSHEVRNPLNAILGFAEVIEKEMFGAVNIPQYHEYAADIGESGRHLLSLLNDVLDISKVEAGMLEIDNADLDIGGLIESSLSVLKRRAQAGEIKLAVRIARSLPRLRGDERRIRQVLLNLLTNASKFTPSGGKVRVSADADAERGLRIRVTDTGVGMRPEDIDRALTPFVQIAPAGAAAADGTGLGLPLAKSLVERHGGRLHMASRPGKGTTVTVRFPAMRLVA